MSFTTGSSDRLLDDVDHPLTKHSKMCVVSGLLGAVVMVTMIFLVTYFVYTIQSPNSGNCTWPFPSPSVLGEYSSAAVASDAYSCSQIGSYLLLTKKASAVDAAIATMLCNGVVNMHSSGLGGGGFMLIYDGKSKNVSALDFRPAAPSRATPDMFAGYNMSQNVIGPKSIGIPGEIQAFHEAWKRYGRVPWIEILQPTIDLLTNGYAVTHQLAAAIVSKLSYIKQSPMLSSILLRGKSQEPKQAGDIIINKVLAKTLLELARDPASITNGTIARNIVQELGDVGGILTPDDLETYIPLWHEPVFAEVQRGINLYGVPPPASSVLAMYGLNVLSGYSNINYASLSNCTSSTLFYHRLIETWKFMFAKRPGLGDMKFAQKEIQELVRNLTSSRLANETRGKIRDDKTFPTDYYGPKFSWTSDSGTSHVTVIDGMGNAVAVTSTVNTFFGSLIAGNITGFIYNNAMGDFALTNVTYPPDTLPEGRLNRLEPGKRPMSSMSPLMALTRQKELRLVFGGAGGTYITSGAVLIGAMNLLMNKNIKTAIDQPRLHHQLLPDLVNAERNFPKDILEDLRKIGHKIGPEMDISAFDGVTEFEIGKDKQRVIQANADYRKGGTVSGF